MKRRQPKSQCDWTPSEDLTETLIRKLMMLPDCVKTRYLKQHLLTKYVSTETAASSVRYSRALNKWLATERDNEATNERLLTTREDFNILPRISFSRFVAKCRDIISDIIGETVPVDALIGSFSGGASTSRNRTESYPSSKFLGRAHATAAAKELFEDVVLPEIPAWSQFLDSSYIEVVRGNVMFTVPKNADIDRCACKEPDINMFMQKGIGNYIRSSLRKVKIDLNNQSVNRELARQGSILGHLSTLDLSSASDSVSTGLVELLLPSPWFTVMNALRSDYTLIDSEWHANEMFSSMGNGFTFELESLIFYSLARATAYFTGTSGIISVYGDDLITPTEIFNDFQFVLCYFGFSLNQDKSMVTGTTRESCGGHFDRGVDITPFYLRGPILLLTDIIHVANQLRQWGTFEGLDVIDPEIEDIWLWLKNQIPREFWGGEDTSFKFQLVSFDTPEKRIHLPSVKKLTGEGGYLHWLNATWQRTVQREHVETSSRSVNRPGLLRVRRTKRRTVPRLQSLFLHEIVTSEQ